MQFISLLFGKTTKLKVENSVFPCLMSHFLLDIHFVEKTVYGFDYRSTLVCGSNDVYFTPVTYWRGKIKLVCEPTHAVRVSFHVVLSASYGGKLFYSIGLFHIKLFTEKRLPKL